MGREGGPHPDVDHQRVPAATDSVPSRGGVLAGEPAQQLKSRDEG
jgi:hypothetical protein